MTTAVPLTAEEQANVALVDTFIAAWNARDADKVMACFAEDARFAVGPIGATPEWQRPDFAGLIRAARTLTMTVTPGTTWARGPVVTHERVDEIVLPDQDISGTFIAVFTLRDGRIVDFIDFII